jgi:hypothetical protein
MADTLKVIDRTIQEHRHIQEGLKNAGDSITDIEAMFALNKEYAKWSQSSVKELKEKQGELLKGISTLEQGLKRHFSFEEESLPPLLGEVLMKTIQQEHVLIKGLLDKAKDSLREGTLQGLNQRQLLSRKAEIQANIHQIVEAVEEHAGHEETILKMIQKALEA